MPFEDGAHGARSSSLDLAKWWTERGFYPVPVPRGSKRPVDNGWPNLRLRLDELPQHFSTPVNVGVLTGTAVHGDPSNGVLCDVDFDCIETIAAWPEFSPPPTWTFGRATKRRSHAFYLIDAPLASIRFTDPVLAAKAHAHSKRKNTGKTADHLDPNDEGPRNGGVGNDQDAASKAMLVELRCVKADGTVGFQTIVPGSMHPSREIIEWEPDRAPTPTLVKAQDLVRAVERTVAAAILARYWPPEGSRNEAFLALAGMLARNGWSQEEASAFARAVYRILWPQNPDFRAAEAEVRTTFEKFPTGADVTGLPRLKELGIEKRVLDRCIGWLHMNVPSGNSGANGGGGRYFERNGRLYRHGPVKDGVSVDIQLTSFTARIVENIAVDDGIGERLVFRVRAEAGGVVREFVLSAMQFEKQEWPMENLGVDAYCLPREWDHAKAAIRSLSVGAPRVTLYAHLGWHLVDGERIYLHGPGAIGPRGVVDGIETQLSPALARYELHLPRDLEEARTAILASLRTLRVAASRITYPLLAFVYRAVLGPVAFVIFLLGSSGAFKSSIASVLQQHFGPRMGWDMEGFHLPLGFESTANAAEAIACQAKDTLLTMDDYTPTVDPHEAARTHGLAARLIRSVANNTARQRLSRDGSLQAGRPPRCALLITAEHPPREKSLMARLLVIEIERDEVKRESLSASQRDGDLGLLCKAMAAFVEWWAVQFAERIKGFAARARELRSQIVGLHARTPGAVAELWAAFELFLQFAVEKGAIDEPLRQYHLREAEVAFRQLASSQGTNQREADPALRFRDLVRSAVTAHRAHICNLTDHGTPEMQYRPQQLGWRHVGSNWVPGGDAIGWIGDEGLFLNFEAAQAVAQKLATDARDPLPIGGVTLKRCLNEAKMLASRELNRSRLTTRLPGDPARTPVLHVVADFLGGEDEEKEEEQKTKAGGDPPGAPTNAAPKPPVDAPPDIPPGAPADDLEYLFKDLK